MLTVSAACSPFLFQFTPLREGRRTSSRIAARCKLFQFTPLREGRLFGEMLLNWLQNFNSRPSARGDMLSRRLGGSQANFNSRPSARGDSIFMRTFCDDEFQFTPLREGRPPPESLYIAGTYFNSRPSARGDVSFSAFCVGLKISIHAPPRGATSAFSPGFARRLFQFTPLREGRLFPSIHLQLPYCISIHAPPRGATFLALQVA